MFVPRSITGLAGLALIAVLAGCSSSPAYRVVVPPRATAAPAGTVLIVLSAAPTQTLADGRTRATGYFLNELYEPLRALEDAGYAITIATPGGRRPALDPESLDGKYWKRPHERARALELVASDPRMLHPESLQSVASRGTELQALVVPGGQGVMVDLLDDPSMHRLLADFGATDRPVGLICHAPAILSRIPRARNPFVGRLVTSVSGFEEWYIETFVMGSDAMVRGIGDRLEAAGFRHDTGFPGRSNAVRDCNLVTSQNPFSGGEFNTHFLGALMDWRRGGRCVPTGER